MWHVTADTWHITCVGGWAFFQNCMSLALMAWVWRCFEDFEEKGWLTELMNHEAVCRTAPATPGLSNTACVLVYEWRLCCDVIDTVVYCGGFSIVVWWRQCCSLVIWWWQLCYVMETVMWGRQVCGVIESVLWCDWYSFIVWWIQVCGVVEIVMVCFVVFDVGLWSLWPY